MPDPAAPRPAPGTRCEPGATSEFTTIEPVVLAFGEAITPDEVFETYGDNCSVCVEEA
jgi:hypothetical protein